MATRTLGTSATTSLTALAYLSGIGSIPMADVATLNALIKSDAPGGNTPFQSGGYFSSGSQLFIPRRGFLKIFPGDYVAVDAATGWPILLSAAAIAGGPWTHT